MFAGQRLCILAPHTDDGELGAGGTIHRFAGDAAALCYVAFSTCAESLPEGLAPDTLKHECRAATAELGIARKNVTFHDFRVRRFSERRQDILDAMIALRASFRPDIILTPSSFDIHQDHRVIHDESLRAFKTATLLGYELPWNCLSFAATMLVGLSEANMAAKIRAVGRYESQSARPYASGEALRAVAAAHGLQAGTPLAEAFEVIRCTLR